MTDAYAADADDALEEKLRELRPQRLTFRRWIDRHWSKIWLLGLLAPSLSFLNVIAQLALVEMYPALRGQTSEMFAMIGTVAFSGGGLVLCVLAVLINRELMWLDKLFYLAGSVILALLMNTVCVMLFSAALGL